MKFSSASYISLAMTAVSVLPEKVSAATKSFALSGDINAGGSGGFGLSFAPNSSCNVQYESFPWTVSCDVGVLVSLGLEDLNDGGPVEVRGTAGVSIDAADLSDPSASFQYGTSFGRFEIDTLFGDVGDSDGFSLDTVETVLDRDALLGGLCLSNLPESIKNLFPAIPLAQESAALIGADVCASAPGLTFTSGGLGGQIKLLLDVVLFDPNLAASEPAVNSLGLDQPIKINLDLGGLVAKTVFGGDALKRSLRGLEEGDNMPIDEDGNFLFGTSVPSSGEITVNGGTGGGSSSAAAGTALFGLSFSTSLGLGALLSSFFLF